MTGKTILLNNRADCEGRFPDRLLSPLLILKKIFLIYISESRLSSDVKNFLNRRGNFSEAENPLSKRIYLSGEDPRFYKRGIGQYPARLSGGLQSPTEINAQLRNAPQEHCYACIGTRGCAGIRFGRSQLTLTRIPRQFSRARIEFSGSIDSDRENSVSGMADSGRKAAFGESAQQRSVPPSRAELNRNADMLMRRFGDSILSFAYTYMQNRQDAEEILQDTMIAYLLNAPVFANDAHARAWLLTTARNLSMNRLRYNRYRRHADLDETLSERLAAPSKEDHSYLLDAVRKLPENMRESIYLFYWEGYSTSQIAVVLDRRETTVRSDLSRARKRLKDILKEEYDFE